MTIYTKWCLLNDNEGTFLGVPRKYSSFTAASHHSPSLPWVKNHSNKSLLPCCLSHIICTVEQFSFTLTTSFSVDPSNCSYVTVWVIKMFYAAFSCVCNNKMRQVMKIDRGTWKMLSGEIISFTCVLSFPYNSLFFLSCCCFLFLLVCLIKPNYNWHELTKKKFIHKIFSY